MDYKVLITTSGLGSRLGDLTKYTNKSLVRVGKKPTLSYIIEAYPDDVELVITVGHFGDHVRQFVKLAYPERKINFVDVDKYQGEGSSLGYSMLCAQNQLQCPFIFHAGDTTRILNRAFGNKVKNRAHSFKVFCRLPSTCRMLADDRLDEPWRR